MGQRGYRASGYMPMNSCCRGRGGAFGRGYGFRRQAFTAPWHASFREPTPAEEMSYLEDMASKLEQDLKGIRERIDKLRST